jgi:GcrA cell cycle regulator
MADDIAWTDTRIELLRKLWADGLACSLIAAALGGITRSAVIGKVHRLGLSGRKRKKVAWAPRRARLKRTAPVNVNRGVKCGANGYTLIETALVPIEAKELPASAIPVEQRKTLAELEARHCRWPYGDPGTESFFFCGAPEADFLASHPYCRFHASLAGAGYARQR